MEFLIGLGAFAVPHLFALGERVLLTSGETNSLRYLSLSALVLAASILPWCVCMGTTFPLMMAYVRERDAQNTKSFSFLYLANVLGAMSGTFLTAVVLVELFGFHQTLRVAAAGNFVIAIIGVWLGRQQDARVSLGEPEVQSAKTSKAPLPAAGPSNRLIKWILFSTGFVAMALEVVWTRAFTPVLKTQVYSFALIVFTYLGATFLGSWRYRRDLTKNSPWPTARLMGLLMVAVFLPILAVDPRWVKMDWDGDMDVLSAIIVLAGICPFCAVLGYLTPGLIDEYAAGDPAAAGKAYAVNVLGCILGPLFAGYVLLPQLSERYALILLGLPFSMFYLLLCKSQSRRQHWGWGPAAAAALAASLFLVEDFETMLVRTQPGTVIRRDYAATVISFGEKQDKRLLVNGIGMTILTPITKFMAHLPIAFHQGRPESALIICFGMGTSYRSALSWNLDTTAIELVPDVTKAFGFYHADAARILDNPRGHIVIDDGRRFLKRTSSQYDIIVVDPPPPVEAAGSSLLYSTEFYELAKQHLKPHGILQAWFPGGEKLISQAVLRSVRDAFPHVRCFMSVAGWGTHMLASLDPIEEQTPGQLAARVPAAAQKDLLEWAPAYDLTSYLRIVLVREFPTDTMLHPDPGVRVTDDDPLNEYFLLRRLGLY